MFSKKYSSILAVLISSVVLYFVHKGFVGALGLSAIFSNFNTPLELLYFVFGLAASLITFVLIFVKDKDYNQVGMAFLGLITVKMIAVYLVFKPKIPTITGAVNYEKINFIILFILFLVIETIVAIKILKIKNN